MPQLNKFEIEMFAKRAAQDLLEHGRDLNESIMEIAGTNDLSREQTRRVVECANTIANGEMVKRAKITGSDPRVTFNLADSTVIFSKMIGEMPEAKLAQMKKVAQLGAMFCVPVAKPAMEKVASIVEPGLSSMSGPELAAAYLGGRNVSTQSFTLGQVADAVDDLVRVADAAREKWAQLALCEENALAGFERAVEAELHAGLSPATIKAAMARAPVLDEHMAAGVLIVDAKAREMERVEGVSKLAATTIVDERSAVITELCTLLLVDAERDVVLGVSEKIADAHDRATADLNAARAAGDAKLAVNLSTVQQGARNLGSKATGIGGGAFKALGVGLGAVEAKNRAQQSTKRLKTMQMTPAVGPMKMAAEKLTKTSGFGSDFTGFFSGSTKPSAGSLAAIALASGVAAAGAAGAGKLLDAASKGVGGIFERRQRDKLFETLLARDPALKKEQRAREYFDLVLTYAPALGDHPTAIGDFLKRQLQYPVSGVEFLAALAKLQNDVSNARRPQPSAFSAGVGDVLHGAQSEWLRGQSR